MIKYILSTLTACLLAAPSQTVAAPESWKQTAEQALMNGNRAKAIEYFEKWAEADPTDAVSLYNLSCCYALEGRKDEALRALMRAADAGWSDSIHTVSDEDLALLRRERGFFGLLNRISSNARQRGQGYTSNVVKQERWGRYVMILPDEYDPSQKYPLVVLLHGYGQSPEQFAEAARYIDTHRYIYIVPEGPYAAMDSEGKGYSFLRELENYAEDPSSAPAAAEWVVRAADDAMQRYPVEGKRFYLIGFSQGAALAHITAALYPERIAGYAAHDGYIIKNTISEDQLAQEKKAGLRVLITHGQDDAAVAVTEGVYANNMLKDAGLDVNFEMMAGGHVFSEEVGRKVGDWLAKTP